MTFSALFPNKIIFENGSTSRIGALAADICNKPLLLTGGSSLQKSGDLHKICIALKSAGLEYCHYSGIDGEPTPHMIDEVTQFARDHTVDAVIAVGGGSVIDTGKAAAGLAVNQSGVVEYLEGIGSGLSLTTSPLPFIAVPTTAGTGAEVTKNAVVTDRVACYKKSFRDERLVAQLVIIDPALTISLPPQETAYGGMDAITQLIEAFVTRKHNPLSQALAGYCIPLVIPAITVAFRDPDNLEARTTMCLASLCSGLALANAGLGAVHGFASGMGGMFDIPHGLICSVLLPHVCRFNSQHLPGIFDPLATAITGRRGASVDEALDLLFELNKKLHVPDDFSSYSIDRGVAVEIVQRSQGSSMSGNPVDISFDEWVSFISELL